MILWDQRKEGGEQEVKTKIIFVFVLVISMLFGNVVPAFASAPPEKGTFTMGIIEFETDPGEQSLTGDIIHIRNSVGEAGLTPLPWGNAISSIETIDSAQGNVTTGIGTATSKSMEVYEDGSVVLGSVHTNIEGPQLWTYDGPTFSFTLNGRTFEITHGATYFGLYTNIIAVKHGVSGSLKGLETKETAAGVIVLTPDLTPVGLTLGYATGTYTWLR